MPGLDKRIPAASFTLFNDLPKELQRHIWMHALPGPRIIHVERHLVDAEEDEKGETAEDSSKYPLATYFSSPSPNGSIASLLCTCRESHTVVKQHYSLLFPASSTWISFSIDFLYLDWGTRHFTTVYSPEHFTPAWPKDPLSYRYMHPEFNADIARQVKNLVVFEHTWRTDRDRFQEEDWVIGVLLRIFSAVEVLVFADQLHSRDEASEELVWFSGELAEGIQGECGRQEELQEKEEDRLFFRRLMLWEDWTDYGSCYLYNLENLRGKWENRVKMGVDVARGHTRGREMPRIARKSITSAPFKKSLLEICGSGENMRRKLTGMDFEFVKGKHEYSGDLNLSQQIAFLKLVLSRVPLETYIDSWGSPVHGPLAGGIPFLSARIDVLKEEMMRQSARKEADEMA